ncbi:ribonuclease H-like domain-containing protein [Tanacetum coccineum]|uniref:Ribonuclease H-like domain-containing protein n=1 Tax=Tanacetum coccineum TaxID=301880 RepID=A0ABQ5FY41_9ASTR
MITRSQSGIVKPIERLSLHTSSISPILKSPFIALKDPNWCNAIYDKYNALVKNGTWILVPRPSDVNLVRSMWLYKHKFHADGTLSGYKARLVANGSNQQHGVDFDETFSPVVKSATIRTVQALLRLDSGLFTNLMLRMHFLTRVFVWFESGHLMIGSQVAYFFLCGRFILTTSSPVILQQIVDSLLKSLICDLGALNIFLALCCSVILQGSFVSEEWAHVSYLLLALICPIEVHQGTMELGLQLYASATTSLGVWYNLLSWSAKRQHTISRSSAEAEYQGVANVVAKTTWIRNLLRELHSPLLIATLVYCDNYADIFTKGLPSALFEDFRSSLQHATASSRSTAESY